MSVAILIAVLVILLVAFACFWLIDQIGLPNPINVIAKAIVAILALVFLLQKSGLM